MAESCRPNVMHLVISSARHPEEGCLAECIGGTAHSCSLVNGYGQPAVPELQG
jgi:hypothetical protein